MAAIHSLSDNLQGILVELSEKIGSVEEKNTQLEDRTKELETKEIENKATIDELSAANTTLQDRVTLLEQQLNVEAECKLRDMVESNHNDLGDRLKVAEDRLLDHDKLVDRLESCEKKLASFYGEDTNILGRVGHLETRFKDFKSNEDAKLEQHKDGLNKCLSEAERMVGRLEELEEGLGTAQLMVDSLGETKLDREKIQDLLVAFMVEHRLLNDDSMVEVVEGVRSCKEDIDALSRMEQERQGELSAALQTIRNDIETLQHNSEPAHKYECFGSDQAVKIFQIESRLQELEGTSTASLATRLEHMDALISAATGQMDRVLAGESLVTNNFDRIGTDYVHLSRLISDMNEEISGHDHRIQDFEADMRRGGREKPHPAVMPGSGTEENEKMNKLSRDVAEISQAISSADHRMSLFADECKDSLSELQAHNDKKIDILAVWVSRNMNLLASSTRRKLKQLLAAGGGDDAVLLSGQQKGAHCLSCHHHKNRPKSASLPRTRVSEGKSPIFKITHLDPPHAEDNNSSSVNSNTVDDIGPAFKMTVPDSLRMKVSNFRGHENGDTMAYDGVDESSHENTHTPIEDGPQSGLRTKEKVFQAKSISSQSLPRKFSRNHHDTSQQL